MDVSTPHVLRLPNKKNITVFLLDNQQVTIQSVAGTQQVSFSGNFAADILALFQGNLSTVSKQRLVLIEKAHPWLMGLSQATIQTENGKDLLLGEGLGMFFLELTSQCNEKCIHCYADSAPERSDFLSFDEIKTVLDQVRGLGRPKVQLTGGDPLIHRHLRDIVAYAHGLDFQGLEIYTNGLLLTDKLLASLQCFQPSFAFSMYAGRAETHDLITRVPGSFERTSSAIKRAMAQGFTVRVSIIRMQENEGQEKETYDNLHDQLGLEPHQINFHLNRDIGRGSAFKPQDTQVSSEQPGEETPVVVEAKKANKVNKERKGKLCVSATGDVYPCVFSRDISLGNIRQQSLIESIDRLQQKIFSKASPIRWKQCQDKLSCSDCQLITYLLGEQKIEFPINTTNP